LFIDVDGNLKIADFVISALCQQYGKNGLLHLIYGIPIYVAPEAVSGRGYNGASADFWLCSVILIMLLAGYIPFQGRTVALYKKILQEKITCLP
jgi:serine/threonine protein kinase